jgi:peptide-methionine (R)-S-oxide reductase
MGSTRSFAVIMLALSIGLLATAGWLAATHVRQIPHDLLPLAAAEPGLNTAKAQEAISVEPKLTPEQLAVAKRQLTPEQYNVCFLRGTEPPGSGKYEKLFDPGTYHCAVCGTELFTSETKYDSHSGWPAFWDAADTSRLQLLTDHDLGYPRTEVRCKKCGAHLGHVFEDGPKPTGLRYCINSAALEFVPDGTETIAP